MIILEIAFVQFKKGKPLWKHNSSLLTDKDYLETMSDKIDEVKKQYALPVYNIDQINNIPDDQIQFVKNDQHLLETLLMELEENLFHSQVTRKKAAGKKEKELISNIGSLEINFTDTNLNEIENLKEELYRIRKNKMEEVLVRARAKIIEDDEKPTYFFCNLEKYNYTSKIVSKLETNNGKVITDQFDI